MTATLALAVLLLPAGGTLFLALFGWRLPRTVAAVVGPGVVWIAFVCVAAITYRQLQASPVVDQTYWTWIRIGDFEVPFNLLIDRLSTYMMLVVTGVGALIVTYSVGYMAHEKDASYNRFFTYMDLFIFSMLLLVLAGNFIFLIMGWAMVGLSSYLLIGFYYWRRSAVVAARKAFVMNVIGDVGIILGAFAVWVSFHQVTFQGFWAAIPRQDSWTLELIAALLLVGAIAKSAQLPLHTWLPDAMEGPTPVSALIHAATMVTAGVYLVGRMNPLYDVAHWTHGGVALIGAASAIFAATIALVQTDIKRVLAYSTMSQIGYMFLGVGIGAYAVAFFHLLSHAFFKATLFLAAGNVIHAMDDEQDMRRFGGLWRALRPTSIAFLIGSLSLVGIIPLVGFFSKESILGAAFSKPSEHHLAQFVWVVGALTALLTAFYTGRMWWMAFVRPPAADRPVEHPHEAPRVMLIPVLVLAALAVVGGALQTESGWPGGTTLVSDFLASSVGVQAWGAAGGEHLVTYALMLSSLAVFALAYWFYIRPRFAPWSHRLPWAQRILERKYHLDEAYDRIFVRPMDWIAEEGDEHLEKPVIDGAVMGLAGAARGGAGAVSVTQSGYFRNYALIFAIGALVGGLILFKVFYP